jgi:hypothetical protein
MLLRLCTRDTLPYETLGASLQGVRYGTGIQNIDAHLRDQHNVTSEEE